MKKDHHFYSVPYNGKFWNFLNESNVKLSVFILFKVFGKLYTQLIIEFTASCKLNWAKQVLCVLPVTD